MLSTHPTVEETLKELAKRFVDAHADLKKKGQALTRAEQDQRASISLCERISDELKKHVGQNIQEQNILVEGKRVVRVSYRDGVSVVDLIR